MFGAYFPDRLSHMTFELKLLPVVLHRSQRPRLKTPIIRIHNHAPQRQASSGNPLISTHHLLSNLSPSRISLLLSSSKIPLSRRP